MYSRKKCKKNIYRIKNYIFKKKIRIEKFIIINMLRYER